MNLKSVAKKMDRVKANLGMFGPPELAHLNGQMDQWLSLIDDEDEDEDDRYYQRSSVLDNE